MPNMKVVLVTLVLVIAALAVTMIDDSSRTDNKEARLDQHLIKTDRAVAVDRITVEASGESFVLQRTADGRWFLGEESGFPVDASKVVRLLDDLTKVKFIRVVSEKEEELGEFGLKEPTKLALFTGEEQVLDFQMGSQRPNGGFYGTVGGEYKTYLMDPAITVSADEAGWELKEIVDVEAEQVKSIAFLPQEGEGKPVTLSREKKEDALTVQDLGETEEVNAATASAQGRILSTVRFSKRFDIGNEEAKTALASPSTVVVTLFDERKYSVEVGSVGQEQPKYFLRIKAESGDAKLDDATQQSVSLLNNMMQRWSFEIPSSLGKKFAMQRADFVNAKDPATGG